MFEMDATNIELSTWLRDTYFPEVVSRFNSEASRKRFGLYQNEQIPANERNLTDVRTRMGVLIEFELAKISNELLLEYEINDFFWSYVVANRFPDLEIRRLNGERLLRLEIKCLQCIAEEKSANFDTLIKDIDPTTDFVVVCVWDWMSEGSNICHWDMAPYIMKVYVFHAYSLAALRDTYWLNRPPKNLGNSGYQGFDVRYAVTCKDDIYSKEQGNYGKLTRIWKKGFPYTPKTSNFIDNTISEYLVFQEEIIGLGFELLAKKHLTQLLGTNNVEILTIGTKRIGFKSKNIAYYLSTALFAGKKVSIKEIEKLANENSFEFIVTMTDKYKSTIYRIKKTQVHQLGKDIKPKNVVSLINQYES